MSFWKFIGEFALFNMVWNLFSGNNRSSQPSVSHSGYRNPYDYADDVAADIDTDGLQDRINELETRLLDCDFDSDNYDDLQDEIDSLQDQLDEIEDRDDYSGLDIDDGYGYDSDCNGYNDYNDYNDYGDYSASDDFGDDW